MNLDDVMVGLEQLRKRIGDLSYQVGWITADCSRRGKLLHNCAELMREMLEDEDPDMARWRIKIDGMSYRVKRELEYPIGPGSMDWPLKETNDGTDGTEGS